MSKELNILYGFKYVKGENQITRAIESYGYTVNAAMRYSKPSIKGFLDSTPETDVVVLKEYLEGGEEYSPEELSQLADDTRARIIVLLHPKNRGREAMKTVYIAGIVDAVFADKKMGASPDSIARLAIKGRTRREAREYYHINDVQWPDYGFISLEQYGDALHFLEGNEEDGREIIERFNDLSRAFTKRQFVQFINKLPEEDLENLKEYELFYDIMDSLRKGGYTDRKLKKPKDLKKTLPGDAAEESRSRFIREESLRGKKTEPVIRGVQSSDPTPYNGQYRQQRRPGAVPAGGPVYGQPMQGASPMRLSGAQTAPDGISIYQASHEQSEEVNALMEEQYAARSQAVQMQPVMQPQVPQGDSQAPMPVRSTRRRRQSDVAPQQAPVTEEVYVAPRRNQTASPAQENPVSGQAVFQNPAGGQNAISAEQQSFSAAQEMAGSHGLYETHEAQYIGPSRYNPGSEPQNAGSELSDYKTISNETMNEAGNISMGGEVKPASTPASNGASMKPNDKSLSSMNLNDLISQYQ